MVKSKKGISPLIATVLIIGFTVALAAIIMTWGTKFTRDIQTSTTESANANVACAQDVDFIIESQCKNTALGNHRFTVANNGKEEIKTFKIRYYVNTNDVTSRSPGSSSNLPLLSFGVSNVDVSGGYGLRKVEFIPVIVIDGKDVTCGANIEEYGNIETSNYLETPTCM